MNDNFENRTEQNRTEQNRTEQNRTEQNRTKRIEWIDFCRGVGILLVILGHTIPPFNKIIYGFHMPLFFMLSGFLMWDKKFTRKTIFTGLKRYIFPYFFLCTINLCLNIVFTRADTAKILNYIGGILYSKGSTDYMPNCSPLWFLTCMFAAGIIFEMINCCPSKLGQLGMCSACVLVSYGLCFFEADKLFWNIDTALMAVGFMKIGAMLRLINFPDFIHNTKVRLLLFVGFIGGIVMIIINPIKYVSFDYNRYGNIIFMIIGAVTVSLCIFAVCILISEQRKIHFWKNFIIFYGRHTIFIMGFDYFSQSVSARLLDALSMNNWFILFISKMIVLTAGILLWEFIISKIKNYNNCLYKLLCF